MNSRNCGIAAAVALALYGTAAAPSIAQAQVAALDEIVVTAERRETALQDTPLSLVALTAETMVSKGVEDLGDLALFTPNLAINGSRGYGNNQPTFSIRGISGGGGATSERGVALYIDGIYVPRTNGSVFKVFDLERVEVLRGPQGTLFGRNSEGGAIRLVTKQPGPDFEAYVRGTLGNFNRQDLTAMVNLPMNDEFSLRLQGAHLKEDGYVRRATQLLGGQEDWVGRIQGAYTPNEDLKITFGALYSDSRSQGTPQDFETFDMAPGIIEGNYADWISDALALAGQPRLATLDDPRIVLDDYTLPSWCFLDDFDPDWDNACKQNSNSKYYQLDANVAWKINENVSFTSTTGYALMDHKGITDWQLLGTERRPDDVKSETIYQEFLLNAALFGGKVDNVTGLNYFHELSSTFGQVTNRKGTSTLTGPGTIQNPNGNANGGLFITGKQAVEQASDSWGLFNNATWHITEKLNFTGGLRVSQDAKKIEYIRYTGSGPTNDFVPSYPGASGATSITVNGDDSWTQIDWRATVDYHFTKDIMAYATGSKAYKAGQYAHTVVANLSGPSQSSIIKPISPEEVVNLEAGLRTTFFGGRLRINPTGFYMAWTNRQAARQVSCVSEGTASCPIGFRINTVNSGSVDIWGLELDSQLAVTDNFSVDGSLGVTNYRLRDPVANSGPNLFPSQASPTYNLGATYSVPATRIGDFALNVNYASVGSQETHPTSGTDSAYLLPTYGLVNARLQLTTPDKRNVISLFANNLLDEHYATFATRFGGGYWDNGPGTGLAAPPRSARSVVRGRPREFGITVQHNF